MITIIHTIDTDGVYDLSPGPGSVAPIREGGDLGDVEVAAGEVGADAGAGEVAGLGGEEGGDDAAGGVGGADGEGGAAGEAAAADGDDPDVERAGVLDQFQGGGALAGD